MSKITEQMDALDKEIKVCAIKLANIYMDEWTQEELKTYAFDRLVDELIKGFDTYKEVKK
jgi:hypothetical protein